MLFCFGRFGLPRLTALNTACEQFSHIDADGTDGDLKDGSRELIIFEFSPQLEEMVHFGLSRLADSSGLAAAVLHSLEVSIQVSPAALQLSTVVERIGPGSVHSQDACELLAQQSLGACVVLLRRDLKYRHFRRVGIPQNGPLIGFPPPRIVRVDDGSFLDCGVNFLNW